MGVHICNGANTRREKPVVKQANCFLVNFSSPPPPTIVKNNFKKGANVKADSLVV